MPAKLIDAGIDYLRITTPDRLRKGTLLSYFNQVVSRDFRLGYKKQKGGAFGFFGEKTRHALYGEKEDWTMLQISGYEAKQGLNLAVSGTQCTRIDIQATYRYDDLQPAEVLREEYQAAWSYVRPKSRPPSVKLIEERGAAETVYVGSRASDIYVRLYDKYKESGKEEFKGCVRFEVEIKGRAAKALWQQIMAQRMGVFELLEMLRSVLQERGIVLPGDDFSEHDIQIIPPSPSPEEKTISWWAKQVAPSVGRVTSERGWQLAFHVLFGKACTEWDRSAIMNALSLCWGS